MSSILAWNSLLLAGELAVASMLIMALAFEAAAIFGRRASLRHLIWLAAFGVLLLLPVLALLLPPQIRLALLPAAPMVPDTQYVPTAVSVRAPVASAGFHVTAWFATCALAAIWLAGVCLIGLRSVLAAFGLRRLRRNSVPHRMGDLDLPDIGRRYEVRIACAPNGCGPVSWGLVRPVILLPWLAIFWTRERLEAVLLHELAHVGRRDSLAQIVCRIACAAYWPNPLVWMGARAMRDEAEISADDAVLVRGIRPSSYAGELLQLATEFRGRQPVLSGVPFFMAAPSALETRVASVLAPTQSRSGVTSMDILKIAAAGIAAAAMLAFARPSLAQDAPPPPPPSVATAPLAPVPPMADAAPQALPAPAALPAPDAAASEVAAPAQRAQRIPPLPPLPPVPPVERVAPRPPVPPLPPVTSAEADHSLQIQSTEHWAHGHAVRHVRIIMDGKDVDAAEADAAQAIARARPQMERALAEAHIDERTARALREAQPRIDAAMAKAMRDVQPRIDKALADASAQMANANVQMNVRERVDAAMKRFQVRVEMRDRKAARDDGDLVIEQTDTPDDK